MNALRYALELPWVQPLGWTLIHFLWQGAVIGLGAAFLLKLLHRRSPNARYTVACGALIACVAAVLATFVLLAKPFEKRVYEPRILTNAPESIRVAESKQPAEAAASAEQLTPASRPSTSSAKPRPKPETAAPKTSPARVANWAVLGWFLGVVVLGLRLIVGWGRVQLWRWSAEPVIDPTIGAMFQRLAQALGVSSRARLRSGDTVPSPLTFGWLWPLVLLPTRVLTGLPPEQIEAILAHELAHIRRGDYLVNLLQSAVEVVLFYHPGVWWIGGRIRQIREECCDEMAAQLCPDRLSLAKALTAIAELPLPPQLSLAARADSLLARISRLLGRTRPEPMLGGRNAAWTLTFASAILAALGLFYSARLIAQAPEKIATTKQPARGRVIDETGVPVSGARVLIYHRVSDWGWHNKVVEEVRSAADGRFAFTQPIDFKVPNGTKESDYYLLFALREGKAPAWTQIYGVDPEPTDLKLRLTPPVKQEYEVVDAAGKPVAGARVWLRYASRPNTKSRLASDSLYIPEDLGLSSATTDAQGRAVLTNLPDMDRSIAASKEGFEDCLSCTTPREGVPRFTLARASMLTGRITDPLGLPVAGAKVRLSPIFKYHQYFLAESDQDGRYQVEKIWSTGNEPDWGKYHVGIEHPNFTMAEKTVAFSPGQTIENFDLRAEPGTEILGTLLDPVTKKPVAGASLLVDSPSGRAGVWTDLEGEFCLRVMPGEVHVIFNEPPGGYYVNDSTHGGADARVFGPQFPLTAYLPAALGRLGTVRGKIVDGRGQPVAKGKLSVLSFSHFMQRTGWRGDAWSGGLSQADGSFEIEDMPIGMRFAIMAESADGKQAGLLLSELKEASAELPGPVSLAPTVSVEVLIQGFDGKPRAKLAVEVETLIEGEDVRGRTLRTDANGLIRIPNAIPGLSYRIFEENARHTASTLELVPKGATTAERRTMTIGDQFYVRLEGPDGEVLPIKSFQQYYVWIVNHREGGRIRWSNGPLNILARQGNLVVVSRDTLSLGKPNEKIDFLIEMEDGGLIEAEGFIPTDGNGLIVAKAKANPGLVNTAPDLSIAPVVADEIALRIVTPDGQPAAGAKVAFNGAHWDRSQMTFIQELTADAAGVLRVPEAKDKWFTYATVSLPGYAPNFLTDLPPGQPLKTTLQNTTRLKGKIGGEITGPLSILLTKNKRTSRKEMGYEVRDIQYRSETAADGAYDFAMEPGKYQFKVTSADGRFSIGEVVVVNNQAVALPAVLRRGHDVVLELLDWPSGQPIEGIEVEIRERRSDGVNAARENSIRTSDKQGLVKWENLMPGDTEFSARRMNHQGPDNQQEHTRWWREDEPVKWRKIDPKAKPLTGRDGVEPIIIEAADRAEPIRIHMEKGVKVAGVVTGPAGQPMANATVAVMSSENGGGGLTGDSRYSMQTDETGAFAGYIPAGNGLVYWLSVGYWAAKPAPAANAVSEPFSSKSGDQFTFKLTMAKGGWLTGRILDHTGEPAPKYRVSAKAVDGREDAYQTRIAEADADGRFRIGPMRPGEYQLEPGTPGRHAPNTVISGATKKNATIADGEEKGVGDLTLPAETTEK